MTFDDYKAKKLNLEVDAKLEKHKIKVNDFINKSEIVVKHKNKKYVYKKNEIYGIRDNKGLDYRFLNNIEYLISQTDIIYIYIKENVEQKGKGKNSENKYISKYFFSKTGDSEILELTVENIKKTFPDNHKMHDAIDEKFKNPIDLYEYDNFHKSYKVIRFLNEYLK